MQAPHVSQAREDRRVPRGRSASARDFRFSREVGPRHTGASRSKRGFTPFSTNDDATERQHIRAARAAAQRRVLLSDLGQPSPERASDANGMSGDRLMTLYQNCIKLAAENKINQKNTWDLELIDHIADIVKADVSDSTQANFQKASCTLEAGVKIYSYRVDSVHSETFKVLSGLNRAAHTDESFEPEVDGVAAQTPGVPKRVAASSTLEPSFESLNVKKFDAALTVDPLFHQTSAQFDEGGPKGLLLYNLGTHRGLEIMFDSAELVHSHNLAPEDHSRVDLATIWGDIEVLHKAASRTSCLTPALQELLKMADKGQERGNGAEPVELDEGHDEQDFDPGQVDDNVSDVADGFIADGDASGDCDDQFQSWVQNGSNGQFVMEESEDSELVYEDGARLEGDAGSWLAGIMGFSDIQGSAWAGPQHWRFAKSVVELGKGEVKTGRKSVDRMELLDFENVPPVDLSLLLAANQRETSLARVAEKATICLLPKKHSYDPRRLTQLYLRSSSCLRSLSEKRQRQSSMMRIDQDFVSEWDWTAGEGAEDGDSGYDASEAAHVDDITEGDAWGGNDLIAQPKKVEKIEVSYSRRSKQVDVKILKETLWSRLHESPLLDEASSASEVSFRQVLQHFPRNCKAAPIDDISVHLCFICLLHLANEQGLDLEGKKSKDEIVVRGVSLE